MAKTIERIVAEQLEGEMRASSKPEPNICDVTVQVGVKGDPLFVRFLQQFVQRFPNTGPIPAAEALAIQCFQAGMLYERAMSEKQAAEQASPIDVTPMIQ